GRGGDRSGGAQAPGQTVGPTTCSVRRTQLRPLADRKMLSALHPVGAAVGWTTLFVSAGRGFGREPAAGAHAVHAVGQAVLVEAAGERQADQEGAVRPTPLAP